MVVGNEVGESGTPHLQGYAEFDRAVDLGTLGRLLGGRAHVEACKGTAAQNIAYCRKGGDCYCERGVPGAPGTRNDIRAVRELVRNTGRMADVIEIATSYQSLRMAELLLKYVGPERKSPPRVRWFWGPTGTGKTLSAVTEAGGDFWMSSRSLRWWDGYDGQTKVIFDDFRADFCTFHELLRILDRYPFRVEVKGGSRPLLATDIWVTSCHPPERVYPNCGERVEQLIRRIHEVREFSPPVPVVQGSGVILGPDLDEKKEAEGLDAALAALGL